MARLMCVPTPSVETSDLGIRRLEKDKDGFIVDAASTSQLSPEELTKLAEAQIAEAIRQILDPTQCGARAAGSEL